MSVAEKVNPEAETILSINNIEVIYNHVILVLKGVSLTVEKGGIVAILGANGAGKTTIFRMIMGEETPDKGTFEVGDTAKLAYVDQSHSNIDPEKTIWENFSDSQELIMESLKYRDVLFNPITIT